MAKVWKEKAHSSPTMEVYEKRLAGIWREMGCAAEGAPYVVRGSFHLNIDPQGPQARELATAFLDEVHCPGARGLTDDEKAKLKAIRDRPLPPAPKQ